MKNKKNKSGYTLVELLILVMFVLCTGFLGGMFYVACHFMAKFW